MEHFTDVPNFTKDLMNTASDIKGLQASITDALLMGDQIVGQQGNRDVVKQSKERNKELTETKNELEADIRKKDAIINRTNRDFTDVKDTLPQTQEKKALNVIEDYTMALLAITYLFMIIAYIAWYTSTSTEKVSGLIQAIVSSIVVTMLFILLLYYLC